MTAMTRQARALAIALVFVGLGALAWRLWPRSGQPVSSGPAATERATMTAPAARFVDITTESGLGTFIRENGAEGDKLLPETTGGGGAFVDVDNDGDLDVVLVNGRAWPWSKTSTPPASTLSLFVNDGTGHFTDRTAASGLALRTYGMGVAAGDFDNDGWTDLFVTAVGQNTLLKNIGGRFHDVSKEAGMSGRPDAWSTCATWFDADNDGDLDLFVCNYVRWSRDLDLTQDFSLQGLGRAYGPPRNFAGTAPYFFVNGGNGRFTERAGPAGLVVTDPVTRAPAAKSLGVALIALDDDRCIDLVVANDTVRNFAFKSHCDGTFEEVGTTLGLAYDSYGNARSGMGIDTAEVLDNGLPAVAIGNFANEMTAFFVRQQASGQFVDESISAGIGAPSRASLTFGLLFFDYDLDGRLDLLTINGHVEDRDLARANQSAVCAAGTALLERGARLALDVRAGRGRRGAHAADGGPWRRVRRHRRRRRSRPAAGAGQRAAAAASERRAGRTLDPTAVGGHPQPARRDRRPRRGEERPAHATTGGLAHARLSVAVGTHADVRIRVWRVS